MQTGKLNSFTDVAGVQVEQTTLIKGDSIRTGVTTILPYDGNIFQQKVHAAVFVGNSFGKLAGSTQVNELGNLETTIALTNTLNVSTAMDALIEYTLNEKGNENVGSVNAVVGETTESLGVPYTAKEQIINNPVLQNDAMPPLFMAVIEATEEAIINSLFAAQTVTGKHGNKAELLPLEKEISIC